MSASSPPSPLSTRTTSPSPAAAWPVYSCCVHSESKLCELLIQVHVANGVHIPGLYTVKLKVTDSITVSICSTLKVPDLTGLKVPDLTGLKIRDFTEPLKITSQSLLLVLLLHFIFADHHGYHCLLQLFCRTSRHIITYNVHKVQNIMSITMPVL